MIARHTTTTDTLWTPADRARAGEQLCKVRALMLDGQWRTLRQISDAIGGPEASCSARLRDIRASGMVVERRRVREGGALFEYRVRGGAA